MIVSMDCFLVAIHRHLLEKDGFRGRQVDRHLACRNTVIVFVDFLNIRLIGILSKRDIFDDLPRLECKYTVTNISFAIRYVFDTRRNSGQPRHGEGDSLHELLLYYAVDV